MSAFDVALDHAAALAQTGNDASAVAVLERVGAAATETVRLVLISCRLAELHGDAGRIGEARTWARRAAEYALRDGAACAWLEDEAAVAQAQTLRLSGDEAEAEALAARSLVRLRAASVAEPCARVREAFASAAILVAERALDSSAWLSAARVCEEARAALERDIRTRPIVRFRVARYLAVAGLYRPDRIEEGVTALTALLQRQLGAGFLAEACQTATTLAATHRVLGRPAAAAATLVPVLDVARSTCRGEGLAGALFEYAWTLVPRESAEAPWDAIAELRAHAPEGSLLQAFSFVVEAAALLARGDALLALRASHAGIEALTTLRRWRYVGMALRLQALSLEALGDLDGARLIISASLERLEGSAHPSSVSRARSDARRLARGTTRQVT